MSKINHKKPVVMEYLSIAAGTALMAAAINGVFDRVQMVTGGFTGLSIMIKSISEAYVPGGIPLGLSNLLLNVPLFAGTFWLKGRHFLLRTAAATGLLSFWLSVLPDFSLVTEDLLLAAVFGGSLMGAGIGLVLRANATTGGTDLLSVLLHGRLRHFNVAQIMQVIDGAIVLAGASVFGLGKALYAVIAVFISMRVSEFLTEGMKFAKVVYIISDRYEEAASAIMAQVERGVTLMPAKGMYSNLPKNMLFCVVSKKEIVLVKDIIREIDSDAFVIVSDAREVLGEGFMAHV